jgi:hypothetical protein
MKWKKIGRVFFSDNQYDWMISHAAVPIADYRYDDIFRIYFSSRDIDNRSHTCFIDVDIKQPKNLLNISSKPVLSPGALGCFDDSGAMASCVLNHKNDKLLYYIGWNLGVTVPFRNSIGLARWDERQEEFVRCFEGPIIDRTKDNPHFVASNHVVIENGIYKIWYLSCVGWLLGIDGKPVHNYHIKYAESNNGIDWIINGDIAIDFYDKYEYAISVPRVLKENEKYKMWFSSRATKDVSTYRIRYAESNDGIHWVRKDEEVGIDVSSNGWDSEMLCYPYVFDHKGKRYMLYNGNGYGKTGFGLAVLEQD